VKNSPNSIDCDLLTVLAKRLRLGSFSTFLQADARPDQFVKISLRITVYSMIRRTLNG
jgi:hypothetical protein